MDAVWPYVAALLPTILVAILFYFIVKSMLEGDRRERLAQRRFEAEQDLERKRTATRATDPDGPDDGPSPAEGPDSPRET